MYEIKVKNNTIKYEVNRKRIKNIYISIKEGAVIVTAPIRITDKQIKELLEKKANWICKKLENSNKKKEKEDLYTKEEFINIVQKTAKELINETGIRPNKMRIRKIQYAWGSCSSGKNITINENLIKYSEDAIKYVILHELCHIKYMNHSKEFWSLVEFYMPNYKQVKKELKQ